MQDNTQPTAPVTDTPVVSTTGEPVATPAPVVSTNDAQTGDVKVEIPTPDAGTAPATETPVVPTPAV